MCCRFSASLCVLTQVAARFPPDGYDKYGDWTIPFRNEAGEELVLKRLIVVFSQEERHLCAEEFPLWPRGSLS